MAAARNTGNELWEACTVGDLEAVQRLVKDPQVDVNWRDPTLAGLAFFELAVMDAPQLSNFFWRRTLTLLTLRKSAMRGVLHLVLPLREDSLKL